MLEFFLLRNGKCEVGRYELFLYLFVVFEVNFSFRVIGLYLVVYYKLVRFIVIRLGKIVFYGVVC